jgi:hypothetical protein
MIFAIPNFRKSAVLDCRALETYPITLADRAHPFLKTVPAAKEAFGTLHNRASTSYDLDEW